MAVYFNDSIRCYEDGRVERLWRGLKWKEVPNMANATGGYNHIKIDYNTIKRQRIIAACFLGLNIDDPKQEIDHINRDRLDNRVENLRIVTRQQNAYNQDAKGCSKQGNKWKAYIKKNQMYIYLGLFDTEEKARQAYLDAKAIYHTF